MYIRQNIINPLQMIFVPLGMIILFLSISRTGLFSWQFERVQDTGQSLFIFIQGLRFDLALLSMAMVLPVTLTPLFATNLAVFKYWRKFLIIYMTLWFAFIVFMEFLTPSFINQYDSRPNYIFIEYLKHYKEVGATLLAEYPWQLLLTAIVVPLFCRIFYKFSQRFMLLKQPVK